jgi:hypothetical protein
MLNATRVNPKIIPIRIIKKIFNIMPMLKLMTESGRKKKIEVPTSTPMLPKIK